MHLETARTACVTGSGTANWLAKATVAMGKGHMGEAVRIPCNSLCGKRPLIYFRISQLLTLVPALWSAEGGVRVRVRARDFF